MELEKMKLDAAPAASAPKIPTTSKTPSTSKTKVGPPKANTKSPSVPIDNNAKAIAKDVNK